MARDSIARTNRLDFARASAREQEGRFSRGQLMQASGMLQQQGQFDQSMAERQHQFDVGMAEQQYQFDETQIQRGQIEMARQEMEQRRADQRMEMQGRLLDLRKRTAEVQLIEAETKRFVAEQKAKQAQQPGVRDMEVGGVYEAQGGRFMTPEIGPDGRISGMAELGEDDPMVQRYLKRQEQPGRGGGATVGNLISARNSLFKDFEEGLIEEEDYRSAVGRIDDELGRRGALGEQPNEAKQIMQVYRGIPYTNRTFKRAARALNMTGPELQEKMQEWLERELADNPGLEPAEAISDALNYMIERSAGKTKR